MVTKLAEVLNMTNSLCNEKSKCTKPILALYGKNSLSRTREIQQIKNHYQTYYF